MAATFPSGTVTFLFTDIEGSTKLWEKHPEGMKRALARHDDLLRHAIEGQGGNVIKTTGDGFHAAFETGLNGVAAALAAQQSLLQEKWDELDSHGLRVRIGLHTGEAEARAGDYYGPALNRAARIMAVGYGGQTLLSTTTADLVRDQLPPEASLRDLGEHRLKDLVRPEHVFQLNHPALPAEFPALRSVDAFPNNLPIQLTSFIGRERELEEAKARLASARLLTLIGPGGTGKTRLGLQLAADLLPHYADGVWVAELAPLTDPALVLQTIASIFGVREQMGMSVQELLVDFLRDKDLLLVIDNCEHLIDTCAQLIEQLLQSCSKLKIVASSREALGIMGETVYRVPSLSVPTAADPSRSTLARSESVQLFVERATAANPRFILNDQNAAAIGQICRRLDGIPLALELAAARLTVFSPEQVASRLDDRFRLLTGGSRTALPRQQTLRALIDWSYDLLSEPERKLFRKFSVFAGGCTFEAAETICSEMDVLNLLTQLVNKSLVAVEEENGGPRYRLLETVRQYARDKLLETGESEQARNLHFEYFYNLAKAAEPGLNSPQALEWIGRLAAEHDNMRAALEWGLEKNVPAVLSMAPSLVRFWIRQGHEEEGRAVIGEALARAGELPQPDGEAGKQWKKTLAEAWNAQAMLAYSQGDNPRAAASAGNAAALARELGDKRNLALVLGFEASSLMFVGEASTVLGLLEEAVAAGRESGDKLALGLPLGMYGQALTRLGVDPAAGHQHAEEGAALMQQSGDRWAATMGLLGMAMSATFLGNHAEARSRFSALGPRFAELGDQHRLNMVRSELAHIDRKEGQLDKGEAVYRETILEWKRLGHRAAIAHQLECFASIAQIRGNHARAARLNGAAEALRERIAISMTPAERVEYDERVSALRAAMEETAFGAAWAEGRQMGMDQAIAYALEPGPQAARSTLQPRALRADASTDMRGSATISPSP
jgi:predicted ATPase/class 3 adenylate cyclase